jgi:hypothetical protein
MVTLLYLLLKVINGNKHEKKSKWINSLEQEIVKIVYYKKELDLEVVVHD